MWLISACSPENKSYNGDLQTSPAVLPAGVFCVLAKYQHFGCITIDYYYFIFFIFYFFRYLWSSDEESPDFYCCANTWLASVGLRKYSQ